jgi:hypothetical protein
MVEENGRDRPSLREALGHPWVHKQGDVTAKAYNDFLVSEIKQRASAENQELSLRLLAHNVKSEGINRMKLISNEAFLANQNELGPFLRIAWKFMQLSKVSYETLDQFLDCLRRNVESQDWNDLLFKDFGRKKALALVKAYNTDEDGKPFKREGREDKANRENWRATALMIVDTIIKDINDLSPEAFKNPVAIERIVEGAFDSVLPGENAKWNELAARLGLYAWSIKVLE